MSWVSDKLRLAALSDPVAPEADGSESSSTRVDPSVSALSAQPTLDAKANPRKRKAESLEEAVVPAVHAPTPTVISRIPAYRPEQIAWLLPNVTPAPPLQVDEEPVVSSSMPLCVAVTKMCNDFTGDLSSDDAEDLGTFAQRFATSAIQHGVFTKRDHAPNAAACVFLGLRQTRNERSFKDVAAVVGIKKSDLSAAYRTLSSHVKSVMTDVIPVVSGPKALVKGVAAKVSLTKDVSLAAKELVATAGGGHLAVVAAAIYLSSHAYSQPRSANAIATAAGVAMRSLNQRYRSMHNRAAELVNKDDVALGKAVLSRLPPAEMI